jgi:hypothetical protein
MHSILHGYAFQLVLQKQVQHSTPCVRTRVTIVMQEERKLLIQFPSYIFYYKHVVTVTILLDFKKEYQNELKTRKINGWILHQSLWR